jgi:hypothetical protein
MVKLLDLEQPADGVRFSLPSTPAHSFPFWGIGHEQPAIDRNGLFRRPVKTAAFGSCPRGDMGKRLDVLPDCA